MDKTAFFTMPSGLYVVSAAADGLRAGCVINTAVQVTSMPPRISVAVNKDNPELTKAINEAIKKLQDDGTVEKLAAKWLG